MTDPQCTTPERTLPRETHYVALTRPTPTWPQRILVGTDGTAATDAAIRAAHFFAQHAHSKVVVAEIYAPRIPIPQSEKRRGICACERCDRGNVAHLATTVRSRYRELVPDRTDRSDWEFRIDVGDPGAMLVRLATELRPDLVIVGLAQREPLDTHAGGRTAVCAARYIDVPLFAAAANEEAPSRVIVALPDGKLHAPTLRAALACVSRPAKLWLAFPERHPALAPDISDSHAIAAAVRELCGPSVAGTLDEVRLERIDVSGDMLDATLRLADELYAQIIAIPNHGDPGPVRTFLPNLAEPLLFGARCSVLVVPDDVARAPSP